MVTDIFIQAKMASSRLPGKVLTKILNKSILELIVERAKKIENFDRIILVTGSKEKNELLLKEAKRLKIHHFCGSEENILDRFFKASKKFNTDIIIRLTADNPLVDFNLINKGLNFFKTKKVDIVNVDRVRTYPLGLNFQIFSRDSLEKSWKDNLSKYPNEKKFMGVFIPPTKYLLEKKKFSHYELLNDVDLSNVRLTLDHPEDFELISTIFNSLYPKKNLFTLDDIIDLLHKNPKLLEINKKYSTSSFHYEIEK